jgi:hypothetical protein
MVRSLHLSGRTGERRLNILCYCNISVELLEIVLIVEFNNSSNNIATFMSPKSYIFRFSD